ncbi:hypothetical protein [uncultured Dokdonia sp.]|uniref:hypothetical protein n=1 Tax=uncultured Dokdonia sp. TaxID=575653 RepID=UPI002617D09E|nr:hypothetical protein [uncultured Dokdonia sp.]
MKKIILIVGLVIATVFNMQGQEINAIPYSSDISQLPDGWHKFTLQGASFDVEVASGNLVKGNVIWFDGTKYSGNLAGSVISGRGTYTWPDGTRYEGAFRNNQRHGKGSMILLDNSKWSGKWKNNKKNGKGKQFDASGEIVQQGVWEGDQFLGAKKK